MGSASLQTKPFPCKKCTIIIFSSCSEERGDVHHCHFFIHQDVIKWMILVVVLNGLSHLQCTSLYHQVVYPAALHPCVWCCLPRLQHKTHLPPQTDKSLTQEHFFISTVYSSKTKQNMTIWLNFLNFSVTHKRKAEHVTQFGYKSRMFVNDNLSY